jgi:Flp pilus assembly protein TadD
MATTARADRTGLDGLDTRTHPARDGTHFRRILAARQNVAEAERELREAVRAAHDAGDSWTVIGAALDTTRQAAFQRFGKA